MYLKPCAQDVRRRLRGPPSTARRVFLGIAKNYYEFLVITMFVRFLAPRVSSMSRSAETILNTCNATSSQKRPRNKAKTRRTQRSAASRYAARPDGTEAHQPTRPKLRPKQRPRAPQAGATSHATAPKSATFTWKVTAKPSPSTKPPEDSRASHRSRALCLASSAPRAWPCQLARAPAKSPDRRAR